ncbi:MAG: LVIVD repeat-containing protein [Gemmatimonadota bacterium]
MSTPATSNSPPDSSDPRVGLRAGGADAEQAIWNLRLLSATPAAEPFAGVTNSDLAFMGDYAIQGNYNGFQVWNISDPADPVLRTGYFCPASQSDVSVYQNLLFVSGEGLSGRIDCGGQGVADTVSSARLRGLRIFDISDIDNPVNVGNVQTCRGSHTHTVLVDPDDDENVYVYISGSSSVRSPSELPGCSEAMPEEDPNTALFRIEVIKVPLAHPEQAAIVSSPRIFDDLEPAPTHGESEADKAAREAALAEARETGGFIVTIEGQEQALSSGFVDQILESIVEARGGTGSPTAADSAALRAELPEIIEQIFGDDGPETGPTQCHDITVYPAIGLAGGACGGYGLLLDISDPIHPKRIAAVADSNFSYWHSATFNNDGTKLLFSDEWGGGGGPKCRATDPKEWGADAIFTVAGSELNFESYYKLPAPQTPLENCVAHNGSLIPIPGRDVMVQAWYQGGISVFDWTDPSNPREIAFFDRGPMDSTEMVSAGSWSVYWYNGAIVSSEIARGLDILELTPSEFLTQNEIDAARTVHLDYLNVQGQQQFVWPPSFALARAYLDQLERSNGLAADRILDAREALDAAEDRSGQDRRETLSALAAQLEDDAQSAGDQAKVRTLAAAVADLADAEG